MLTDWAWSGGVTLQICRACKRLMNVTNTFFVRYILYSQALVIGTAAAVKSINTLLIILIVTFPWLSLYFSTKVTRIKQPGEALQEFHSATILLHDNGPQNPSPYCFVNGETLRLFAIKWPIVERDHYRCMQQRHRTWKTIST